MTPIHVHFTIALRKHFQIRDLQMAITNIARFLFITITIHPLLKRRARSIHDYPFFQMTRHQTTREVEV